MSTLTEMAEALRRLDALPRESGHALPSKDRIRAEAAVIRAARALVAQCQGANRTSTDGPNPGITSPKLEERYIVVKLKDLIPSQAQELRDYLTREEVPTRDCVVVEADWPQYEQVVDMVVGDQKC